MRSTKLRTFDTRLVCPHALTTGVGVGVLAVVAYGGHEPPVTGALGVQVPLEVLGHGLAVEVWTSSDPAAPTEVVRRGALTLARGGPLVAGSLSTPAAGGRLEPATLEAFREVLAAIAAEGCPHLLRVWACLPGINREEDGLERYKAFCRARATAFEEAWGSGFTRRLPASTAVGSDPEPGGLDRGDLVIHCLAARTPGRHVENPHQVAAYRYPGRYGPRSPSFARATLAPAEAGGLLFVSGTASIVGHESVHTDLAGQARETTRNLERVREAAGEGGSPLDWSLLKVYLRHRADEPEARRLLAELLPEPIPTVFLRADVCRRELLIEIEGVARPTLGSSLTPE